MVSYLKVIRKSWAFNAVVTLFILISAALVGIETYPEIMATHGDFLHRLDKIILGFFVLELGIRMGAYGERWWLFFAKGWNIFDFAIVSVCLLPIHAEYFVVMRLFRIFRVLRLVTVLPRLQILVGALLNSIPSIGYIALLLTILFYVYGAIGVMLFGANDPVHFGNIARAMLSLFQVITLEGWVDIMYTQMLGSAVYGYESFKGVAPTSSSAAPALAALYFVSFILIGTMIVLNLFVGVILNAIEEQQEKVELEHIIRRKELGPMPLEDQIEELALQLENTREGFEILRQRITAEHDSHRFLKLRKAARILTGSRAPGERKKAQGEG